jgi:NADH:ubiquinone oxidoreductase subunit K
MLRGLFLMAIAAAFGLGALRYSTGELSHPGPGFFPLLVSSLLFLIGLISLVRSRFAEPVRLNFNLKNIAIILASLCGFAVLAAYLNVTAGVVFLVFFSSLAASTHSFARNLKVSAGLIAIAFAFHKLLGLNLPLY